MEFSLIMATYGREKEVDLFLKSITEQNYDISKVEIIIEDQNDTINLDKIIKKYHNILNIKHIRSNKKGLSYNRNIGLKLATGKYIAFPDDDCRYYPDTLLEVKECFSQNKNIDVVLGKIYDRKTKKNIIRKWKNYSFKINIWNFFLSYSSITIFTKKNSIRFDNNLGVGTFFGSYEDADYILELLKSKKYIIYCPNVQVFHPDLSAKVMNNEKVYSYGLGFGAFVRKHLSLPIFYLFVKVIAYHVVKLLFGIFTFDKEEIIKRYLSIVSRIRGFLIYENKNR